MKTIRLNGLMKNVLSGILVTLMVFSFSSCARKVTFLTSQVVPAAQGYVQVKSDKNNNYVIQVHLSDLAEVERLEPSKQSYVIWMVTDREMTENIGQVNSSNHMNAYFETVSSSKPTKIFITAETDPSTQYPGELVVLTTDNFWD